MMHCILVLLHIIQQPLLDCNSRHPYIIIYQWDSCPIRMSQWYMLYRALGLRGDDARAISVIANYISGMTCRVYVLALTVCPNKQKSLLSAGHIQHQHVGDVHMHI